MTWTEQILTMSTNLRASDVSYTCTQCKDQHELELAAANGCTKYSCTKNNTKHLVTKAKSLLC